MLRNLLVIISLVLLFGLIGHFEYEDNIKIQEIDKQNKIEVIKDIQIKCMNGTFNKDDMYCKGI